MDNEAEVYVPEYAEAIEKMKGVEEGVAALPDAEDDSEMVEVQAAAALRSEDVAAAAKVAEVGVPSRVGLVLYPRITED